MASTYRVAVMLSLALAPAVSAATIEEGVAFSAERFRPASNDAGIIDVESAAVGEHLQWDVALWTGYALNPVVYYTGLERTALVGHRVGANLTANLALFGSLELLADLPLLLVQGRDDAALSPPATAEQAEVTEAFDGRGEGRVRWQGQSWAAMGLQGPNLGHALPRAVPVW